MPSRTEIVTAMSNEVCRRAPELKGGDIIRKGTRVVQYSGGYTNVFPFVKKNGEKVAVRCWCADIDSAQERCHKISEYLKNDTSHYFVNFNYVKDAVLIAGALHPVVIMDWVEGKTLKSYVSDKKPSRELFLDLAEKFRKMVEYLHTKNISHGDLQHGNIMVRPDGSLALIDYDSMYIDGLDGFPDVIKGLPGYQHPARINNRLLTPKADYFSELVIFLSLNIFAENPQLWYEYVDTEDLLFSRDDFANLKQSKLYKKYAKTTSHQIGTMMNAMLQMLAVKDINDLLPLELISAEMTPVVTSKMPSLDMQSIINKLDMMMEAIELKRRLPSFDINTIISKLDF